MQWLVILSVCCGDTFSFFNWVLLKKNDLMQLKYVISNSSNPFVNLAVENTLLLNLSPDEKILFLYKNDPCIVMGRFQNPWVECHLDYMFQKEIKLVRRQSGGGCVYHDQGNLNWSILSCTRDIDKKNNLGFIVDALSNSKIKAIFSERSDIQVEHEDKFYKISGSAFKQKKDRNIHHGTLLIESNLNDLNNVLKVSNSKVTSKSTKSVKSNVINLKDINPEVSHISIIEYFISSFDKRFGSSSVECNFLDLTKDQQTIIYQEELESFNWRFGQTPAFTHSLISDDIELDITVKKAKIVSVEFIKINLVAQLQSLLTSELVGVGYNINELSEVLGQYEDTQDLVNLIYDEVVVSEQHK